MHGKMQLSQVAVESGKGKVKKFNVKSKYKRLVISTRYNKSSYTSRVVLRSTPLRKNTINNISGILKKEAHQLCTTKHGSSILRKTASKDLTLFTWKKIVHELKLCAPVLYKFLKAVIVRKQKGAQKKFLKKQKYRSTSSVGIAASIMLKCRNKFLSQAQSVLSVLLYAGHCSKQVCK